MLDPKGLPASDGVDVVELAAAGRLQCITDFFGAFPPILESWFEHLVWRGGSSSVGGLLAHRAADSSYGQTS
jgi:hypothetical protein